MRRVSLLAAAAAAVAIGVLLVAGLVAGGLAGRPAVPALMAASAVFLAFGLAVGWRPALALSTMLAVVAGLTVTDRPSPWASLCLVAVAAAVSHEAARVSVDLRRPVRLGPGVLGHLVVRTGAIALVAVGVALMAAVLEGRRVAPWLVPVALVVAALPVALPRVTALGPMRAGTSWPQGVDSRGRWAAAALVTAVVLGSALMGATARQDIESSTATRGPAGRAATDDAEPEASPSAGTIPTGGDAPVRRGSRNLIDVLLLALACAVIALLVAGLRRNQIPMETEPVDLGPDDPGLDVIAPHGALLDDQAVSLDEGVAAAIVGEITVDLRSEPDPGRAVRFAYARVERRLADQGLDRRPAESEPEFLVRALGAVGDGGRALADLTALFERARFSDAAVPEAMRTAALDALDQLRARLEPVR